MTDKIEIENVNVPGKVSRVDKTKYEAMKTALLGVLPRHRPGLSHKEILVALQTKLPQDLWPGGQKAGWWSKTVQLDLEAKGLVVREDGAKPMSWHQAGP